MSEFRPFLRRTDYLRIGEVAQLWAEETGDLPGPIGREIADWLTELIFDGFRDHSIELNNAQMITAEVAADFRIYEIDPPALDILLWEHPPSERNFILKEELERFCRDRGHRKPAFWFPDAYSQTTTVTAERACEKWLAQESRRHPHRAPKAKQVYRGEALEQWQRLSVRGFDRAWANTVPEGWKRAGRRHKPKRIQAGKIEVGSTLTSSFRGSRGPPL